ncbi:response regulator transcription factor [Pararhizobium sp. DWP3-4]|uniref:response regulator transcription factor n=1 Tax=unclassified Pararhizobium TaxID=2643050 RepID=UPI003CEE087F
MKIVNVEKPVVRVVDDDTAVRASLVGLMRSNGLNAAGFGTTRALLEADDLSKPGCLILDVHLENECGLEFQSYLKRSGNKTPVIIMTGHGDIPMTIRALKGGASDFLCKPIPHRDLMEAVCNAIEADRRNRREIEALGELHELAGRLTPREREVMDAVVGGLMNKQIAAKFGISLVTVKLHRGKVMRKMEVRTIADLVKRVELIRFR